LKCSWPKPPNAWKIRKPAERTIAIETEIVEKIYEAAKQKAKGSP
jgi:hypothetical protein